MTLVSRLVRINQAVAFFLATLIALPFTAPFSSCPLTALLAFDHATAAVAGQGSLSAGSVSVRNPRSLPANSVLIEEKNEKEDEGWKHLKADGRMTLAPDLTCSLPPSRLVEYSPGYSPVDSTSTAPLALRL